MIVGNKSYKNYPYIRQEDIGTNTSNLFIDSLNISNLYLDGIGGKSLLLIASDINKNLSNCWKAKSIRYANQQRSFSYREERSTTIERHLL